MKSGQSVVYYRSNAVGWLELRFSEQGLQTLSYVPQPREVAPSKSPMAKLLIAELDRYFNGETTTFSVPLDPESGTAFQRKVWEQLSKIPYGQTRSYAEIAASVGNPLAARAVGSANKNNPIAIVVPCHRVIKADGTLGGYNSGPGVKKILLELEGIRLPGEVSARKD